jgi:1-acyl-sn-glycerol-3-phosphate acyltransferase
MHSVRSVNRIKKYGEKVYSDLARDWSNKLLKIIKAKIEVVGESNLDKDKKYLFVSNHGSYFDIPILLDSIPFNFSIIYKESLEKTPIFGKSLKYSPFLAIDRESPRKSLKTIIQTKEIIKKGFSILIFPEGTRTKTGKIGDFKLGALKIAEINDLEIVPVSIKGSFEILPNGSSRIKKAQKVKLTLHKPIKYIATEDFAEKLKKIIESGLN